MKKLTILKPLTITSAMLVSSDVAEDDYAQWSGATTYAKGDRAILTSTHKVYESLQAANLNKDPATELTWWVDVGPTNRWRCFDSYNSTQTVTDGGESPTISYSLEPGQYVNAVAIMNCTGVLEATVTMTDPTYGVVYDKQVALVGIQATSDWWQWFFGPRKYQTQFVLTDLPTYPEATIDITLTGDSTLAVGVLVIGEAQSFGVGIRSGVRVGITDYSRKEVNEFGESIFVQRGYAKRASFDLVINATEVDALQNLLADVRAYPCVWVGGDERAATTLFGSYKTFEILLSYPEYAETSLEIEGLT